MFVAIIVPLGNDFLNTFLTRLRKLFKVEKYSTGETISGNTVNKGQCMGLEDYDFTTI